MLSSAEMLPVRRGNTLLVLFNCKIPQSALSLHTVTGHNVSCLMQKILAKVEPNAGEAAQCCLLHFSTHVGQLQPFYCNCAIVVFLCEPKAKLARKHIRLRITAVCNFIFIVVSPLILSVVM